MQREIGPLPSDNGFCALLVPGLDDNDRRKVELEACFFRAKLALYGSVV